MRSRATEDLRVELGYLRDNVVQAAAQRRTATVKAGLETYEALIAEFIAVLKDFNSPYDRDEALAEIHNVGGGWSEIDWVRDDYREIADAALDSDNLNVILPVLHFPIRIAGMAYEQREYLIFAQFVSWLQYLYRRSADRIRARDPDLFGIIRDRLPRYLHELAAYRIGYDLDESAEPKDIQKSCGFAREVFTNFNRLLKAAYDKRRADDFGLFASELQDIFRQAGDLTARSGGQSSVGHAGEAQSVAETPRDVRGRCYSDLSQFRQVIFLGLDAWIVRDVESGRLSPEAATAFRASLYLPSSIPDLWRLSLAVRDERFERELEWSWWEAEEHSGRSTWAGIDFNMLLLRAALLRMLVTATSMTRDGVVAQDLEMTRDLDYLVGSGGGPLITMLDGIAESDRLRNLADFSSEAYRALRARFVALGAAQAERERIEVVEAPLSSSRVQTLRSNIIQGWQNSGTVRHLFQRLGSFVEAGPATEDTNSLQLHVFERKDIFVEESRFSTSLWGEEWGRALSRGEDEYVISQFAAHGRLMVPEPISPESLIADLDRALQAEPRLRDPIVLIINSMAGNWSLSESSRFHYARHGEVEEGFPARSAQLDTYPIYDIYADADPMVIVTDLRSAGVWKQFTPWTSSESGSLISASIYLELESFDQSSAERFLLEVQPNALLLADTPGRQELAFDERVAALRQRVRVLLREQFEVEVSDPSAVRVIRLTE